MSRLDAWSWARSRVPGISRGGLLFVLLGFLAFGGFKARFRGGSLGLGPGRGFGVSGAGSGCLSLS